MRKSLNLFLGLLLLSVISFAQEASVFIPDGAATPGRLAKLQALMEAEVNKSGVDVSVEDLTAAVKPEMIKTFPTLGNKAGVCIEEMETLEATTAKLNAAAHEKFPEYTQEELVKESEKRYPLYKKGDRVSIRIRTNPKKTEKVTGYFNGTVSGSIYIGQTSYRLADMKEIPGNDGPEGEIAKFDPNINREYRQEWRLEYARTSSVNRQKFIEENHADFEKSQRTVDFLENEKRGYTFYQERWLSLDELLAEFGYDFAGATRRASVEKNRATLDERAKDVEAQAKMSAIATNANPIGTLPSAEKELARRAQEEKKRQDMKAQRERDQVRMAEAAQAEAEEAEARRKRDRERAAQQAAPAEETKAVSYTPYVYGAVIAAVLLLVGGWWWNRSRKEEEDLDVSKFFEGKGRLQQEFWDAANADPENFKYVSYLFPSIEAATDALLKLSYIYSDANGSLHSKKSDLRFGCYEHQNGAVAFIGSTGLNYARWREASMIWPDIPQSNYFKVSSEPVVNITIPDLDKINRTAGLHVVSLGTEDIRTDSGEINRVYRYKATNKEEAIKFLGVFDIEEEGLVVRVETSEGEFGKDINGVFMA